MIPLHHVGRVGREAAYVGEAMRSGQLAGGGVFTRRCERRLERALGACRVLLTSSATAALEAATLLCDVSPGDEVVMPSFTFPATANAVVLRGGRPVFVDVRADTLNIDERLIGGALTTRSRAIIPVHYAGVACAMGAIERLARRAGLTVVEDAAHGLGAAYRDQPLGTIGRLGCLSFHATKNVVSGEGGALIINDPVLVPRAEMIRDNGTDRARYLRGEVDRYQWETPGTSCMPSELAAAFLLGQLEQAGRIRRRRLAIFRNYLRHLTPLEERGDLRLPVVPDDCTPNGHIFFVRLSTPRAREALRGYLARRGIQAAAHFVPLHESPMGRRLGYRSGDLPVTEAESRRLLRLPSFFDLDAARQAAVVRAVKGFFDAGHHRTIAPTKGRIHRLK